MAAQVQGGPGQLHRQHLHMYQKDLESQDSLHFHKKILSSLQHAVENYNVESAAYALVQGFLEGRLSCYMPTGNRVLYSIFQPHIDRVPGDPNMLVVNSYRIPDHGVYAGYPAHVDQHIYPHPEPIPIHFVEVKPLKYQNSWHAEMAVELAAKTALETIPQVNEQAQYLLDAHPNEDTIKIVISTVPVRETAADWAWFLSMPKERSKLLGKTPS